MDVSENSVTPKSSILIGFSIINHPFWGYPYFWKHPYLQSTNLSQQTLRGGHDVLIQTWGVNQPTPDHPELRICSPAFFREFNGFSYALKAGYFWGAGVCTFGVTSHKFPWWLVKQPGWNLVETQPIWQTKKSSIQNGGNLPTTPSTCRRQAPSAVESGGEIRCFLLGGSSQLVSG